MNWPCHAGKPVSRNTAKIIEVAGVCRAEGNRGAGAFAGDARRFRALSGKTMSCSAPSPLINVSFDDLAFGGGQNRIDFAVDRAADAEIDHASFGDADRKRVFGVRDVGGARARRSAALMLCGSRALRGGVFGAGWKSAGRREERDDIGAVLVGFEAGKRHVVAGDDLLRVGEIAIERFAIPNQVRRLHRRRVGIVRLGPRFAADNAGERRTKNVLAGIERVAGLAFPEHQPPGNRIAAAARRPSRAWLATSAAVRASHSMQVSRPDAAYWRQQRYWGLELRMSAPHAA